ncbi:hypothetical protein GCM10009106_11400 [Sphingomonas japonica]
MVWASAAGATKTVVPISRLANARLFFMARLPKSGGRSNAKAAGKRGFRPFPRGLMRVPYVLGTAVQSPLVAPKFPRFELQVQP